MGYIVKVWIIL